MLSSGEGVTEILGDQIQTQKGNSMGSPLALECSSVEAKNRISDAYSWYDKDIFFYINIAGLDALNQYHKTMVTPLFTYKP